MIYVDTILHEKFIFSTKIVKFSAVRAPIKVTFSTNFFITFTKALSLKQNH